MSDDNYPTLEINVTAKVAPAGKGLWHWQIETQIKGPDDVADRESALFASKEACTEDMLKRFAVVVTEQLNEL